MNVVSVESLENPLLDPYRNLKRSNLTRWSGLFIAEGVRLVERLIDSDFEIHSILVAKTHLHRLPVEKLTATTVYVAELALLEALVGFNFHNGMMACGFRKAPPALENWFAKETADRLIVACPHAADPDNLGTIIRISAGLGADGLLVGGLSADPFSRRTLRISMGNAFLFPIRETTTFNDDIQWMQSNAGYQVHASLLDESAIPLSQTQKPRRLVLMLGNESDGLPESLASLADQKVMIPMAAGIDSLNVSIAAGIMLHHYTQIAKPASCSSNAVG